MAAVLASTCAGTAATHGDAPGAGPRTRRDWPPSAQTVQRRRENRSSLVRRRRASPPPGEWRCRTRQRQAAIRAGVSVLAGRSTDDGTYMGVRNSGIVAGQAGYPLAICGRLSSRAWRSAGPNRSLPRGGPIALLLLPVGWASRDSAVPLFGITQPFETRLRSSSACIARNCGNI